MSTGSIPDVLSFSYPKSTIHTTGKSLYLLLRYNTTIIQFLKPCQLKFLWRYSYSSF